MKFIGWIIFMIGIWMLVSPQAVLGVEQLKWMANYSFAGEAFLGAFVCAGALLLINPSKSKQIK